MFGIGATDSSSPASLSLLSNFVLGVSGTAVLFRFIARESQSSINFTAHVFVDEVVEDSPGNVDDLRATLYTMDPADVDDHDGGGAIDTIGGVDPDADEWATFEFSNVTLVAGDVYWLAIHNESADPGNNYPNVVYQSPLTGGGLAATSWFQNAIERAFTTSNGWSSAPTAEFTVPPVVFKYNSGTIQGCPFVTTTSHAANQNDRGIRMAFSEQVTVSGVLVVANSSSIEGLFVYNGASLIASITGDMLLVSRTYARWAFPAPFVVPKDTDYDFIFRFSGATSTTPGLLTMGGGTTPADVIACRNGPAGHLWGYVDGAHDGQGSYAFDDEILPLMGLILDDNPVVAGGGGSDIPVGVVTGE